MDSGEEDEFVPRFSGEEDEFGSWWVSMKACAARYGFSATMSVYEAGKSDPNWPNHPKAHLMIAYLKWRYDMEEEVDVEEDVDVEADDDEEEDDDDDAMVFSFEEDDVENEKDEEDDNEFICGFDEEEEEDDDEFICVFDEEEEEDDDAFIVRLSNMVDLDDLLDNEGVEAEVRVESEARVSVESEARESVESVKDLSGGTNEALHVNEALELQDQNEMSKRVKDSDDEHVQFLFDRGRDADSVVTNVQGNLSDIEQQQQVKQQQARESAGIDEKWQRGRCRFEVQVCDSGWALAATR
jgi:hypothetical protein